MAGGEEGGCPIVGRFNFCFWAKFIVGIPALFIAGSAAAMQFDDTLMQSAAWVGTVMLLVWGAMKLDRMPALQKKVCGGSCHKDS